MSTLTWKQLTSIEVGGAICLPVIMVGHRLYISYGLSSAIAGMMIGNFLLLIMGVLTVKMSVEHRLPTAENAKNYFGDGGSRCFAVVLMAAKTAWFAVQINMMVVSVEELFQFSSPIVLTLILSLLIVVVAQKGIVALSRLSSFSMPVLIITLISALYLVEKRPLPINVEEVSWAAISVTIGAAITAVIDMPTYFRQARSKKDGMIAVVILFLIAIPCVEGIGIYLAYHQPTENVMTMLMHDDSFVWNAWVMLFLILAGWTTNNTNLYSAAICLKTLLKKRSEMFCLVLIAFIGTALALFHVMEHLTLFLQILGICVGSMGAVILTNFAGGIPLPIFISLTAWVAGAFFGILHLTVWIQITPVAVLDAFLVSTLITVLGRGYEIINNRSA